jgi:BlaI family transcriptional regulator, penicillinase repressor
MHIVRLTSPIVMNAPKLTPLELRIMDVFWSRGACSVREIHEALPAKSRPAYTTVQTTIYRMEGKGAVRCTKRISNANIFEAAVTRAAAQNRLIDDLLALFGGHGKPVVSRLVETGNLTLDDIREAERVLRANDRKERKE